MSEQTNIQKLSKHIKEIYLPVGITVVEETSHKVLIYENNLTGSLLYLSYIIDIIRKYNLQFRVIYDRIKKQCVLVVTD